jgi:hypothetical protein
MLIRGVNWKFLKLSGMFQNGIRAELSQYENEAEAGGHVMPAID